MPSSHQVALHLVSRQNPLLHHLDAALSLVRLPLSEEVPGAETFLVAIARLHHVHRVGIFVGEVGVGIVESFL